MEKLSQVVLDFVIDRGASRAGIVTTENLEGGPPSTDLSYILPDAKSAVSFAVQIDQSLIEPYLTKKEFLPLEHATYKANTLSSGISLELATYLNMKGIPSSCVVSNRRFRSDPPHTVNDFLPDISHRYLAVRSGVGHFGLSGNIITKENGSAVILGTVVTTAELIPTDPLPDDENYCDDCKLCMASCASGFMDSSEKQVVTLGGVEFSYSKRKNYPRCGYVCGGFTGLHSSGKWSTWSPGRFMIPEADEDFLHAYQKARIQYMKWPKIEGGQYYFLADAKIRTTCAHCQFICSPDKKERERRFDMLIHSGVVIQNPDGTLEAVSVEEAKERISKMPDETRNLYEESG